MVQGKIGHTHLSPQHILRTSCARPIGAHLTITAGKRIAERCASPTANEILSLPNVAGLDVQNFGSISRGRSEDFSIPKILAHTWLTTC